MTIKESLRQQFKLNLRKISDRSECESKIRQHINELVAEKKGVWGAFSPLSDEPQIDFQTLPGQWCFPKVRGENLTFLQSPPNVRSQYGMLEPIEGKALNESEIAGVFVPGLAFDKSGYRLGRGKGFYDRYLKNFKGFKVAVCFQFQIIDELPQDPWDQKLDALLSESGCVWKS